MLTSMPDHNQAVDPQEQHVLREVLRAMRSVRFGYVQITMQDAKAVQIETLEKRRLER